MSVKEWGLSASKREKRTGVRLAGSILRVTVVWIGMGLCFVAPKSITRTCASPETSKDEFAAYQLAGSPSLKPDGNVTEGSQTSDGDLD